MHGACLWKAKTAKVVFYTFSWHNLVHFHAVTRCEVYTICIRRFIHALNSPGWLLIAARRVKVCFLAMRWQMSTFKISTWSCQQTSEQRCDQCWRSDRNIASFAPGIMSFYYQKNTFIGSKYPFKINTIVTKTSRVVTWHLKIDLENGLQAHCSCACHDAVVLYAVLLHPDKKTSVKHVLDWMFCSYTVGLRAEQKTHPSCSSSSQTEQAATDAEERRCSHPSAKYRCPQPRTVRSPSTASQQTDAQHSERSERRGSSLVCLQQTRLQCRGTVRTTLQLLGSTTRRESTTHTTRHTRRWTQPLQQARQCQKMLKSPAQTISVECTKIQHQRGFFQKQNYLVFGNFGPTNILFDN